MTSNDFKNGMTILFRGAIHEILEFQHIKPGKGGAFVRAKLRNFLTGTIIDHKFNAKENVEQAFVERKRVEYIYRDGDSFYFMEPDTYDQFPVHAQLVEPYLPYLRENQGVEVTRYEGEVIQIKVPESVELRVTKSQPGMQGDTATSATKSVELETGVSVNAPLFIQEGDVIKVDTRTGAYIGRA
jgi:elongation factor P